LATTSRRCGLVLFPAKTLRHLYIGCWRFVPATPLEPNSREADDWYPLSAHVADLCNRTPLIWATTPMPSQCRDRVCLSPARIGSYVASATAFSVRLVSGSVPLANSAVNRVSTCLGTWQILRQTKLRLHDLLRERIRLRVMGRR
jgi:hypothetical protein